MRTKEFTDRYLNLVESSTQVYQICRRQAVAVQGNVLHGETLVTKFGKSLNTYWIMFKISRQKGKNSLILVLCMLLYYVTVQLRSVKQKKIRSYTCSDFFNHRHFCYITFESVYFLPLEYLNINNDWLLNSYLILKVLGPNYGTSVNLLQEWSISHF